MVCLTRVGWNVLLNTHSDCARRRTRKVAAPGGGAQGQDEAGLAGWSSSEALTVGIHKMDNGACRPETAFSGPRGSRALLWAEWVRFLHVRFKENILGPVGESQTERGGHFISKTTIFRIGLVVQLVSLNVRNLNMPSPAFPKSYRYTMRRTSHLLIFFCFYQFMN